MQQPDRLLARPRPTGTFAPPPSAVRGALGVLLAATVSLVALARAGAAPEPPGAAAKTKSMAIELDARDAPRKILHARMTIPAKPGPLTLRYPKWLPGEHGPNGPIADLAGLRVKAGGQTLEWSRDEEDMYAIHVVVPAGADQVEVFADFLSPADAPGFSSGASATEHLALLSWNQLLLYPEGIHSDDLTCAASLKLPEGWKYGTALPTAPLGDKVVPQAGSPVQFAPVSLTTLVDSPVLAGDRFRTLELSADPAARICIAADSEAALEVKAAQLAGWKQLIREEEALFGAHHYRNYTFLLTLSDHTAHFGLEHHESSDNRVAERSLVDDDLRRRMAGLLPHEMTHSWNGKYRRPGDLGVNSFDQPMRGDLLWVYEGLTSYLGNVMAARSGLLSAADYRDLLAATAATMAYQKGREWRPLRDTAVAAQLLYESRDDGGAWRRDTDFYPEGTLIWLEADTIIREQSGGARSLDDFCRLFYGGESGAPEVVPYTFDDVVTALTRVTPYDWRGFLQQRIDRVQPQAPLGGIERAGWTLSYADSLTPWLKSMEKAAKNVDVRFAVGFVVREDGTIPDVIPDSPAARAGIASGNKLVAVNGRKWCKEVLREGVRATRQGARPLELLVESGEFYKTCKLDYSGGERYPCLTRNAGKPDLLGGILAGKVPGAQAGTH